MQTEIYKTCDNLLGLTDEKGLSGGSVEEEPLGDPCSAGKIRTNLGRLKKKYGHF